MIDVFMVLLICGGNMVVFDRHEFPSYERCEAYRAGITIDSETVEQRFQCVPRTICIQSEKSPDQGEENAIYQQASSTNQ